MIELEFGDGTDENTWNAIFAAAINGGWIVTVTLKANPDHEPSWMAPYKEACEAEEAGNFALAASLYEKSEELKQYDDASTFETSQDCTILGFKYADDDGMLYLLYRPLPIVLKRSPDSHVQVEYIKRIEIH